MFKWPLNVSNFTWLDRIKICLFFINPKNFWTQGKYVKLFEKKMAEFMGYKYAIFVSSGSTANTILAMHVRDTSWVKGTRDVIVLPSTTWQTSCGPWIREGFKPHFLDVSLTDFGMKLRDLEEYLRHNHDKVAVVFPTSLLGSNIDYDILHDMMSRYPDIYFAVDQCENNFGSNTNIVSFFNRFTCTTSTYFGHQLQSVEGGFIFTNCANERDAFLMYRNHGLTRGLENSELYRNNDVDSKFDFHLLGNNFRNSDINAFIGLLDFKRIHKYLKVRKRLTSYFLSKLDCEKFHVPSCQNVLFCLPIIFKNNERKARLRLTPLKRLQYYCEDNGIEYRPIISGFLGYHTPYKKYMKENDHPNSKIIHNNGIYVGLHTKLTNRHVNNLITFINGL